MVANVFGEEDRKKLYDQLVEIMIKAMESGEMSPDDARPSATFILDKLEGVQTQEALEIFLQELVAKWPGYAPVLTFQQGIEKQQEAQAEIDNIKSKLQSLAVTK
ncbi:MAG: hypothetical protein WC775_05520 [Patescibacteria group bacterium]|jgi:hypothetical protein